MFWSRLPLGPRGERRAARYLRSLRYRILARSYRCPLGEIDLIAEHDNFIIFIEVKTRSRDDRGEPWQAVDARKRRQITRAAVYFLKHHQLTHRPARFDIIAITWPPGWWTKPSIIHYPDAFPAEGPWST